MASPATTPPTIAPVLLVAATVGGVGVEAAEVVGPVGVEVTEIGVGITVVGLVEVEGAPIVV